MDTAFYENGRYVLGAHACGGFCALNDVVMDIIWSLSSVNNDQWELPKDESRNVRDGT